MQSHHCAEHKYCSVHARCRLLHNVFRAALQRHHYAPQFLKKPPLDVITLSGTDLLSFGTSAAPIAGLSTGQSAAAPAFGQAAPRSSPAPGSTFGFPQSQPAALNTAAFGFSQSQPAASSGFGFGQSQSQSAASSGVAFGFGQAQSAGSSFGFGQQPASSAAASTPGLFGQPVPQSTPGMHCCQKA